jgi:transposase InsO family protein
VLWVGDVTEHPPVEGKVYLATEIDAYSRRVVGVSIADHLRAEVVVDALQMAIWRRHGRDPGTVMHTDHGSTAGLNRSSQHLDDGGGACVFEIDSERFGSIGVRSPRLVHRRSPGARTMSGSGRRLRGG